jgi:hypothetical protein
MPAQRANWSCSACSLAWILRSTGVDPGATEESAIEQIGYPNNINATYGLMDGSGTQLMRVMDDYGLVSSNGWFSYDTVYAIAGDTTGCMSGGAWYHWVAIRGRSGPDLWIANSAQGYKGVYEILTREQFNNLGPFSVVYLEL